MLSCSNCGEINNDGSKFCRNCGYKLNETQNNSYDEYNPAYGKVTRIIERKLDNSKLVDKIIDVTSPSSNRTFGKMDSLSEKFYASHEPEFLEVYNTIEDDFLKSLFMLERAKYGGGGTVGATALALVSTPTSNLSHEESKKFYEEMLKKIIMELETEKQKPNFNQITYFKKKRKEFFVENTSNMGVPRHLR